MRRNIMGIAAAAMVLAACGNAEQKTESIEINDNPKYGPEVEAVMQKLRENRFRAGVFTCPYEWGPYADTPAPKGYKPFYVSHYGRHGSRSNWDEKTYRRLIAKLEEADKANMLTAEGQALLATTRECLQRHNGMSGRLTQAGVDEHRGIAERMYGRFKSVFDRGNVRAISSVVPRCIISMTGFTDRLSELAPELEISWDTGETYMHYLSPDVPSSYTKGADDSIATMNRLPVDSLAYLSIFFNEPGKASDVIGRFGSFEWDVFAVARITASFGIDSDIIGLLPEESLYNSWLWNNAHIYFNHADSRTWGDLRMDPAGKTVADIIEKADAVIAGEDVAVDLRFGHDYPLTAMLSHFGFEGVSQKLTIKEMPQKWFGSDYTPFAGNLQMILYRGRDNDVLAKFLINERESAISGLEPATGPYYRWEDVKAHVQARSARFREAVEKATF